MPKEPSPEHAISQALRPGSWNWNVDRDLVQGDLRLAEIFGLDPEAVRDGLKLKEIVSVVHPDDRADLFASLARSLEFSADYEATYRLQVRGAVRWVHAVGRCYETSASKRHVGIALDITGLRTQDQREALRLDRMAQHCLAAYRLARGSDRLKVRDSIGMALHMIAEELAQSGH